MFKNIKGFALNKKFIKYLIVLLVIAFCAGGYGIYKNNKAKSAMAQVSYKQVTAQRGDLTIAISVDGKADLPTLGLSFPTGGKIKEIYVTSGQKVKKGDVLAELDITDLNNQLQSANNDYQISLLKLEQAKANHNKSIQDAKSAVDSSKSQVDKLYLEYYPMTQLPDAYTKTEIEQKRMDYENAKRSYENQLSNYNRILSDNSDIKLAELNLQSAQTKLKTINDNIANAKLIAPSDGTVLSVSNSAGEVIGENVKLIQLSKGGNVAVTAQISEIDLPKIKIGQEAEVEFEAYSGKEYTGKITSINLLPNTDSNGIVSYNVSVQLDSAADEIKTGMNCTIKFILKQKKDVLYIPNKAVKMVNGQQVVYIQDKDGNKKEQIIKTGFTDGTNVEVVEGLNNRDIVLVEDKKTSR